MTGLQLMAVIENIPLNQTGKRGSCRRDIVRDKEIFRRDTHDKTLAHVNHAWLLFTEIKTAREISFPKRFYE